MYAVALIAARPDGDQRVGVERGPGGLLLEETDAIVSAELLPERLPEELADPREILGVLAHRRYAWAVSLALSD